MPGQVQAFQEACPPYPPNLWTLPHRRLEAAAGSGADVETAAVTTGALAPQTSTDEFQQHIAVARQRRRCRTRLSPPPRRAATGQSREPAGIVSTVASPGMFEGAGITDTMTRRLSIPVPKAPACVTRMAEEGTPLRISSRRTTSARSAAVLGVSPASLSLPAWIITIAPLPAFRAALATTSAATGDSSELLGRKNTAALGNPASSPKGSRAMVISWAVVGSDGEATRSRVPKASVNIGNSSAVAVPGIQDGDLLRIAGDRLVKAVIRQRQIGRPRLMS